MSVLSKLLVTTILIYSGAAMSQTAKSLPASLRVATFNVSMEALNYLPADLGRAAKPSGNELANALAQDHQQIKNIAEIIQRVNPDIILLNEFDGNDASHKSLKHFLAHYLAKVGQLPNDAYGYGLFSGHFAMALLSKHPIVKDKIRTFQLFKWSDMPNALQPIIPETNTPWYSEKAWRDFRLSSKSHWDIPVNVNGNELHILANDKAFVILGDLNADAIDGNAIKAGIQPLIEHPRVVDPKPRSEGGKLHRKDNPNAQYHTAFWGVRADYVLPAKAQLNVLDSGIFWPTQNQAEFSLVKDRAASSDHRMVWVDVVFKDLTKNND